MNIHDYIEKKQPNITQICVYKDDKVIYQDEWNDYKVDDAVHVMSVTKSIVSLLYGIALDQGLIKSIDEKVLSFFPEYQVKRGEKTIYDVTIRHLLTMRAPYKGKTEPWTKVCTSYDWSLTSLDFLGGKSGLTDEFRYTTVCLHILSGILFKVTKMNTVDFANKYLFEPLGIKPHHNFYAKNAQEHKEFTLNKKPIEHIWFTDPNGLGTPGYGLSFSAVDLAKIGQLCLHKGEYNGKRVVSEEWIKEMSTPREINNEQFRGMKYGYLWWIIDAEKGSYAAIGNSGNVIYINPSNNVVVGITAYFKPTVFDRIDFIVDYLEPTLFGK